MASKSSLQVFNPKQSSEPLTDPAFTPRRRIRNFITMLLGYLKGWRFPAAVQRHTNSAWQTWALSSASGDVTATINGVDNTVTYATSDTVTAGLMVAAINASTTALSYGGRDVEADNRAATWTLTSTAVGTTLKIGNYTIRAVAKAAGRRGEFEVSGNDTADAAAVVTAISTFPALNDIVVASSSSGVVTIRSRRASTAALDLSLVASAEVLSGQMAAGATVLISAVPKGVPGNFITLAASGTGATAGAARLAGGTTTYEVL